jgi:RNA polymerase sigma-70 factor (ECF subfamily)
MNEDEKIEKLYRYRPAVLGFMRRLGFSPEEARDLTQTVFVRVCQSVAQYRGQAAWGYLEKIARHVALNEIRDRHAQKREGIEVAEEEAVELSDKGAVPADSALEAKERTERLRGAVERLDPTLRTAVLLYLSDTPYEEIARTLGITVSAVKSRLHAARGRLREWIGEEPAGLGGE